MCEKEILFFQPSNNSCMVVCQRNVGNIYITSSLKNNIYIYIYGDYESLNIYDMADCKYIYIYILKKLNSMLYN